MSKVLIYFGKCSFALRTMHHKSNTTPSIARSLISCPLRRSLIAYWGICHYRRLCCRPIFHSSASFAAFLITRISFVKNIFASFPTCCHRASLLFLCPLLRPNNSTSKEKQIETNCWFSWRRSNGNGFCQQPQYKRKRWYWGIFCEMGGKMGRGELGLLIHRRN